jgi:hypothetical protein
MLSRAILSFSLVLFASVSFAQTFSSEILTPSGFSISGDFNRDGLPDLAIVNTELTDNGPADGALYVYLGTGGGNFTLANINYQIPKSVSQILTADMNGDGKLDLIFATGSGTSIFYGDGNGNFAFGKSLSVGGTIQLGDVNNDGKVDVVSGGTVMLNKGGGVFTKVTSSGSGNVLADVTGDGKLDLVSAGITGISVSKGYGTGKFAAPTVTGGKLPNYCPESGLCSYGLNGYTVTDLYNNGKLDVAVLQEVCDGNVDPDGLNCYERVLIYKNSGSGSFSLAKTITFTGSSGSTIAAADVNGDALQDLAISSANVRANRGEFVLGNANGTFTVSENGLAWVEGYLDFTRDLALTSRQDFVGTVGNYGGPDTEIDLNTTPVVNCPPPGSNVLAAKICSPLPGSSPASVVVKASGNSPAGIERLEVWIDGVKKAQNWEDQLSKTFTLTAGTHKITVVAVDKYVGTAKTSVSITVP